jgi:hypothetical protein
MEVPLSMNILVLLYEQSCEGEPLAAPNWPISLAAEGGIYKQQDAKSASKYQLFLILSRDDAFCASNIENSNENRRGLTNLMHFLQQIS